MSDTAAGQSSERLPDFVPGWFRGRPIGDVPEQIREAVRVVGSDSFPLCFLQPGETVRIAKPPMRGIEISTVTTPAFGLAVPPGYWIVRDDNGELRNWRDEDFKARFTRIPAVWLAPTEREADREAIDELIEKGPPPRPESWTGTVEGWKGTQPAEGTRRALIYAALLGREVLTADECLDHADAIEAALLKSTIAAEEGSIASTMFRNNAYMQPEYAERIVREAREAAEVEPPPPHLRHSERKLWAESRFDQYRYLLMRLSRERAGRLEDRLAAQETRCPYGSSHPGAGSCGVDDCPFHHPKAQPGESVDGVQKIVSHGEEEHVAGEIREADDLEAPDAEIVDSDGHPLAGLHVVLGAQDGVPYLSLIELEHLFANLYEDITERQAKRQRRGEEEKAENAPFDREREEAEKFATKREAEEADSASIARLEVAKGINHIRNAVFEWMGL